MVRWESARPILEAMKAPLPEAFEGHYVISVNGIPLMGDRSMDRDGEDEDSSATRRQEQDDMDRLKGLSSLEAKGGMSAGGRGDRQVGTGSSFLFGFSRKCCRWTRAIPISCSRRNWDASWSRPIFCPKRCSIVANWRSDARE